MPRHTGSRLGPAALGAAASPARLEILGALGQGPATTRTLAARLGRSRQSLYYHLGLMTRAGLVVSEENDAVETREQRFRLADTRLVMGVRSGSRRDRAAAARAARAVLRAAERESAAALAAPSTVLDGAFRQVVALRGKTRLSRAALRRAHALVAELVRLFDGTGAGRAPLYSLTIVLTPAREAPSTE